MQKALTHIITRSHDGSILMFSSADGYCSAVVFSDGELGIKHEKQPEMTTVQEYDVEMMDIPSNPTPPTNTIIQEPPKINILQPHKRRPDVIVNSSSSNNSNSLSVESATKPKKRRVTPILISSPLQQPPPSQQ